MYRFFKFWGIHSSLLLFWVQASFGQTRIVQWTDSHSTVETLSKQVYAIDKAGQRFLKKNPDGEFIVYVIGDHTSINPYTIDDGGALSLEALKVLKDRGYTVLFTPGNHDAFDWTGKVDGARLFLDQMKLLHEWGIRILVTNLKGLAPELEAVVDESYPLKKMTVKMEIIGLTIPKILQRSNLNDLTAAKVFQGVESFQETWDRVIPELISRGAQSVIFGVHTGNKKLAKQVTHINNTILSQLNGKAAPPLLKLPLILGGHGHRAVSYREKGAHVSEAGSHGSFSIIDISRDGVVASNKLRHISATRGQASEVDPNFFVDGRLEVNRATHAKIKKTKWIKGFHERIENRIKVIRARLNRPIIHLQFGIPEHKMHLKKGQSVLGNLLGKALVDWAQGSNPDGFEGDVIAMVNSSSYRLESGVEPGPLTELDLQNMYPFLTEAAFYKINGEAIERLYYSLRSHYAQDSGDTSHSPQLNLGVRESGGILERLGEDGHWSPIIKDKVYGLVLDGWLADHRLGQSYRVPEWIKELRRHEPIKVEAYQDVLIQFLPNVLEQHDQSLPKEGWEANSLLVSGTKSIPKGGPFCRTLFSR